MAATRTVTRRRPRPVTPAAKWRRLGSREKVDAIMTSVILPRRLHEQAKIAAMRLHWSMGELMRTALQEWLEEREIK